MLDTPGYIRNPKFCSFASNLIFARPDTLLILIMTLLPGIHFASGMEGLCCSLYIFQTHHHPCLIFHSYLSYLAIIRPNMFQNDLGYSSCTTPFQFVSSPDLSLLTLLKTEALTDRVTFPAFSSLHLCCTSFWRDMLFASSSVILAALVAILVFKAPLFPPNSLAAFSTKGRGSSPDLSLKLRLIIFVPTNFHREKVIGTDRHC